MLELAALTADRLVAEAKAEAESLVSEARAAADGVMDRLADEKAAVETQIASLRDLEAAQRDRMRQLLTEQLALLDDTRFEPPPVDAG